MLRRPEKKTEVKIVIIDEGGPEIPQGPSTAPT
jgi:hypothetical protein